MRKIYSLVLLAATLLVGTNAWAVTRVVSNDTELQDAWKEAENGDVIQLAASFALTKTLWLGTATMSDTPMSLTLDLNGNVLQFSALSPSSKRLFYITHGELNVITSVPGGQIVYTGTPTSGNMTDSGYEIFRLTGSTYKTVDPKTATSGYYSHLTIGEGVYVKAIANAITVDRLVSISGFSPVAAGNIAIPINASGNYPTTSTALAGGDQVPAALNTNVYRDDRGVANGVRIDIHGRIEANKYAVKSNGNLGSPSTNVNNTRQYLGFKADQNGTSYVVAEGDVDYSPFIHIYSTAELKTVQYDSKNAVAAYSGGYARWLVEGSCIGSTGVYVKSGEIVLKDAVIASNYSGTDYTNAVGTNSGVKSGGSGIVMESSTVYAGDIDVTVQGDTKVSATSGYAIDEAVTATDGNTKVDAITIEGGTFESGDAGTMRVTETTVEAAADPNQETVITIIGGNAEGGANLGGQTLQEFLETQQGENAAYVTIVDDGNGGQTMVITQGEAPSAETNWSDIVGMPDGSDANWTGLTPGVIGDGINETKVTLGKLLINAGTSGNLQELTIKNNATLEVEHVVMNAYARITVEPGGKFIVKGDQGIVAPSTSNIILKTNEATPAEFLFKPSVSSNRHPNATVQLIANSYRESSTNYLYQRFGVPTYTAVKTISAKNSSNEDVQVGFRKYVNNGWLVLGYVNVPGQSLDLSKLNDPFGYYTLLCNTPTVGTIISMGGELVGNENATLTTGQNTNGWSTYANSYTAKMSTAAMMSMFSLPGITNAAVYVQKNMSAYDYQFDWEVYDLTTQYFLSDIKLNPMQAFLIKDPDAAVTTSLALNYETMVWNPGTSAAPAPARVATQDMTMAAIKVYNSENVQKDAVYMIESDQFSADIEKGYDSEKYMGSQVKLYIMNDAKYATCATDDLNNTYLGFSCAETGIYTLSFEHIAGKAYALVDLKNNTVINMVEGATYQFYADENENDYRFKIINRQELPTDLESVNTTNNIKADGIYTITGQYLGNMSIWNSLPAGIYVVDGVKKIK